MSLNIFFDDFMHTLIEFFYAPIIFPEMLWILLPVIIAIFLMEMYFSRYPRSGIGYHRSLENAIFLLFIAFDFIRYIVVNEAGIPKIAAVAIFIALWSIVTVLDFLHKLPTRSLFHLSSKVIIAFASYVGIILVYSDILVAERSLHFVAVFLAIILLFLAMVLVKKIFIFLEPKSYEELEHFLKNIEEDVKKASMESEEEMKKAKEEFKEAKSSKKTKKSI